MSSCCLSVGGLLLPAVLTCGFTCLDEQIFNQLGSLHFIELLHADTKELKRQVFRILFLHLVVTDDAQDKTALTICAVPRISISTRLLMTIVTVGLLVPDIVSIAVSGLGNISDMLDFLIDRVLQKFVKLPHFLFDLGDVREFDFDGCTEAMAAELRQSELLAVVGAEFNGHDVVCVGGLRARKKPDREWPGLSVLLWFCLRSYAACADMETVVLIS